MNSELPVGTEALLAERGRLESLLAASEDWRALSQLKSRQDRGEGLSAVNAPRLEALLLDALAQNPFFNRYKAVCAALDAGSRGPNPAATGTAPSNSESTVDDLTRIRGVDGNMARSLRSLGVWTYSQIAEWTSVDIHRVANELGIGKAIHSQNWIEQAALLALANPRQAPPRILLPESTVTKPIAAPPLLPPLRAAPPIVLPKLAPLPPVAQLAPEVQAPASSKLVAAEGPSQLQPATVLATSEKPGLVVAIASAVQNSLPKPPQFALVPPAAASANTETLAPPKPLAANIIAVQATVALRAPPKPFVVTRASLATLPSENPPALTPASQTAVAQPQLASNTALMATTAAAPVVAKAPPIPVVTIAAAAQPSVVVPTMTITEAIAYAAAAARSSQKTATDTPPAVARPEAAPATAKASSPPPFPAPPVSVPSRPLGAPPPLPAGFTPPEPPPVKSVIKPRPLRQEATPRAISIDRDREELAAFNGNVEEASVEIVRKSAPVSQPSPRAVLAATVPVAPDAAAQRDALRTPTPIGRFLKALTGN